MNMEEGTVLWLELALDGTCYILNERRYISCCHHHYEGCLTLGPCGAMRKFCSLRKLDPQEFFDIVVTSRAVFDKA